MDKDVKAIDTGGPAFPTLETEQTHPQFGMTLRDYFAAQALAAGIYHVSHAQEYADNCYLIADAMLKARAKAST